MYLFNHPIFTDLHPQSNTTVGTGNTAVNGTEIPVLKGLTIQRGTWTS